VADAQQPADTTSATTIHVISNGTYSLQCFATDPHAEFGEHVCFLDPGDSWEELAAAVAAHRAAHGCGEDGTP